MLTFYWIPFVALICFFCRLDRIFYKQNSSFCQSQIYVDWSSLPHYPSPLPPSISKILSQPFTYLNKGSEFFVFLSADKEWVIKFPRTLRHRNLANTLQTIHNCTAKLSQETAIVYAHLEKTQTHRAIKLIDRLGHHYLIPIDYTLFVIQRAGQPFFETFRKEPDPRILIQKALSIYQSIQTKGFADHDPIFHKNFGICKGEPFIMDFGRLVEATSNDTLEKMTVSLRDEIARHYPHLLPYYQKLLP